MKTLGICILIAVVATSNGFFLPLFGGGLLNESPAPQEVVHHHVHRHEIIHKTSPVVRVIHSPLVVEGQGHGQNVQVIKVVHAGGAGGGDGGFGGGHGGAQGLGYAIEQGHGGIAYEQPAHVKLVQPIVNKNFYQHDHYHHAGPEGHHHGWA